MKLRLLVTLGVCVALAGAASAEYWTGLGDGTSWMDVDNWDPNEGGIPGTPLWDTIDWVNGWTQVVGGEFDSATIDMGTPTVKNGEVIDSGSLQGPAYNGDIGGDPNNPIPGTGELIIEAGGTYRYGYARMGSAGGAGTVTQNGDMLVQWVINMPRSTTSTATITHNLEAGGIYVGQYMINQATSQLNLHAGAELIEYGSTNYHPTKDSGDFASRLQKFQDYIADGRITGVGGTPIIEVLSGGGFDNGTGEMDRIRVFIPEPATLSLLVLGGLVALKRRR